MEFPRITNLPDGKGIAEEKEEAEIRCLFAGFIYDGIRDPIYTLKLFERMTDKK